MTEEERLARLDEIREQFTAPERADDITAVLDLYDAAAVALTALSDGLNTLLHPVRETRHELLDLRPLPDDIKRQNHGGAALVIGDVVWPDGGTNLIANVVLTTMFGDDWATTHGVDVSGSHDPYAAGVWHTLKRLATADAGPQPDGKWSAKDALIATRDQLQA